MPQPDRTREALQLFSRLAEQHGLAWSHEFLQQTLSFTILPQPGLEFRINLTLQDGDELCIYVDEVSFSFLPFPGAEAVTRFSECFNGLVDGSLRVDLAGRFGSTARGEIIRSADGKKLARYFRTLWPFGLRTNRTIQNKPTPTKMDSDRSPGPERD